MGVVSSKTSLAKARLPEAAAGYHRAWYPVCLSRDLPAGKIVGRDLLGSRLVALGKPPVPGPSDHGYCGTGYPP